MDVDSGLIVLVLLFSVVGIGLVAAWAIHRWSRLKPVLFPPPEETEPGWESEADHRRAGQHPWLDTVPGLLNGLQRALEREKTPEAHAALEAARRLEGVAPELPAAAQSVIVKAVESGELSSLLVGKQGLYSYIVVFPNRYEHPHLIRRYAPFAEGWAGHAELVVASLTSSGTFSAMLCYLFFLSPDSKEGILLPSYASTEMMLVPSSLLQGAQPRGGTCKAVDAAVEFKMAG